MPIRVEARWTDLEETRLGSAGPRVVRDADRALAPETWYPFALADALAGRDLDDGTPDIEADFNRAFSGWHFDPTTAPPEGRYDFASVALHEIGHGLGFLGALTVEADRGRVDGPGGGDTPLVYDRFTEDASGTPLLDASVYPSPSRALGQALTHETFFDGRAVQQATGAPVPLYAPEAWSEGGSYDHVDEETYPAGTPDGLMTPFLERGERIAAPGAATCAVLGDLGWPLAGECAALVGSLPPLAPGVTVRRAAPNPFRSSTRVEVVVGTPLQVRAWLVDVLGRRVRTLADRSVVPGEVLAVDVPGEDLASGVYVIQVVAGGQTASVRVVRMR